MIDVRRATKRFRSQQPGITTWHAFSAGAYYDATNLSFGPVVACDEHLLDPGAGFERHPHARVELISWVLDGALRHEDPSGRTHDVLPGQAQYQAAGVGIEHIERNASESEPLHFVQLWMLTDEDVPDYDLARPPVTLSTGTFSVLTRCRETQLSQSSFVHLYVAVGSYTIAGHEVGAGDSLRITDEAVHVDGDGQLLVVQIA